MTEFLRKLAIQRPWIAPTARGDLGREQRRHDAVLVGGPHRTVPAQEGRSGALLTAETERPVEEACDEPLEAYWNFEECASQPRGHQVNQARADNGLANRGSGWPLRAILKQVIDRHRQIVVGRQ